VAEFFAMGGYAEFVWSTFGLTAAVLIINVVGARRRLQKSLREVGLRAARQRQREKRGEA
jgi:heme exporter protein D